MSSLQTLCWMGSVGTWCTQARTHTQACSDRHIFGAAEAGQARSGQPGELFTPAHLHNSKPPTANTAHEKCVHTDKPLVSQVDVRVGVLDSLPAPSINYMLKKLKVNKQRETVDKEKNNWPLQKSIRTGGHWLIHLLLPHNYLFFFHSFTSLFMGDAGVPTNQRKALLVMTQIKHGLLRGKRLSDYNATQPTCAKNKLPRSQMRDFY